MAPLLRWPASLLCRARHQQKKIPCLRPRHHHSCSTASPVYNFAIARELPAATFNKAISDHHDGDSTVNMTLAIQQHKAYLNTLRKHVPTLCLPALPEHPDCLFVEDTVVAIQQTAVLTQPGHPSRQGEVESIAVVLEQLGMKNLVRMKQVAPTAVCDGGDVLYTGRHLFVGLSRRTNEEALAVLQDALQVPTSGVPVSNALHLKSVVTHLDESTLLLPKGKIGDFVLEQMKPESLGYTVVRLPDVLACNVVVVNGHVLAQDTECEESRQTLLEAISERGLNVDFVDTRELAKKDAALTCCSVLLSL